MGRGRRPPAVSHDGGSARGFARHQLEEHLAELERLADTAGGVCAYLNLAPEGEGTTTIESKTNFLGSAKAGTAAYGIPSVLAQLAVVVEALREQRRELPELARSRIPG